MSFRDNSSFRENTPSKSQSKTALEQSLKDLLENMLQYMEKFIKTKEELKQVEEKLSDFDNLVQLTDIIKNIFSHLTDKINEHLMKNSLAPQKNDPQDDYNQLEKVVQKHESEIRQHIRLEQQLKLYNESIQGKLDECERVRNDLLDSTKQLINGIKRDNQQLSDEIKILKEENQKNQKKIHKLEVQELEYKQQLQNISYLQEKIYALEKVLADNQISTTSINMKQVSGGGLKKISHINMNAIDSGRNKKISESSNGFGRGNSTSPVKQIENKKKFQSMTNLNKLRNRSMTRKDENELKKLKLNYQFDVQNQNI